MPPSTPRPPANPQIVASSLTRGLVFAWVPTAGKVASGGGGLAVDLVTGQKATIPTSIINVGGVWHGNASSSAGSQFTVRPEMKFTSGFTVVTYYRPHTSAPYGAICANRTSSPQNGWEMFYFNGLAYFRAGDGSGMQFCISRTMPTTSWLSHAAVVRPSGSGRAVFGYMNGAYYGSSTLTSDIAYSSGNDTFRLGSSNAGTPEAAAAQIGAVYVFNRELTPAEIRALDADPYLIVRPDPDPAYAGLVFATTTHTFDSFASSSRSGSIQTWDSATLGNAKFSDDSRANPGLFTPIGVYDDWSDYLVATDLTTTVPADALILGIEIDVEALRVGSAPVPQIDAQLMLGGSPIGSLQTLTSSVGTSDSVHTIGGAGDLWGASLLPSDVNASDFGVRVSFRVDNDPNVGGSTVAVDQIKARLTYLAANSGPIDHTGSASGGLAASGTVDGTTAKLGSASGGLVAGMSAAPLMTFSVSVSGGIVAGGQVQNGVTGSASGGAVVSGSVSGELITYWVRGGLISTASATGNRAVQGAATGAAVFGGASSAVARLSPAASGGLTSGGSASGTRATRCAASGGASARGAATAALAVRGAASGGMAAGGSASGVRRASGSASGSASFSGSAAGVVRAAGVPASGGLSASGSAVGRMTLRAGAAGGLLVSGTAGAGSIGHRGAVVGGLAASGTVSPQMVFRASASMSAVVSGTVAGRRAVRGAAVPQINAVFDEGTETWFYFYISNVAVFAGSVSALRLSGGGPARGGLVAGGSVSAVILKSGSVLGGITVFGTTSGRRVALGAGAGAFSASGSVSGTVDRRGATSGGVTVSGSVSGSYRRFGAATGRATFGGRVVFAEIPYDAPQMWQVECQIQPEIACVLVTEIETKVIDGECLPID